jgi:hypothetical protein
MKPASLLLAAFTVTLLTAWSPGQDAKPRDVIEEFDVARDGDALILPGSVNGKPAQFLLDTGASGVMFDRTLLPSKALKSREVFTPSGTVQLDLFEPPTARVGTQDLVMSGPVVGSNLRKMRETSGYEITAILGMEFLAFHVVQIDFDHGKVVLRKTLPADVGTPFNLIRGKGGLPYIWATVDGWVQDTFVLDTGFVGTGCGNLSHGTFTGLTLGESMKVVHSTLALTLGGTKRVDVGRARRLTVGNVAIANPVFSDSEYNMLDLGFLSRFVVTFDFPRRTMYLKQGRRFDEPDRWDRSGLHLIRTAGKTIVHSVDKDSPAAKAGVTAEDIVIAIGDRPANEASLFQLRNVLSSADKEICVAVRRGDERIDATLHLEPLGGR